MTLMELLRERRSIRAFQKKPIPTESVERLVEALLRAPSSRNHEPWEFVFVDDPETLEKLSEAKRHGSSFLKDAALGIVVCAREDRSDVWIEDCAIAAILVQLASQSLGLGSCWVQIRKRNRGKTRSAESVVRSILQIPDNVHVASIIALGYAAEERPGREADSLRREKIHNNKFGG